MKCPKCGYLAFESGDRCRNCGYDFSLAVARNNPLDRTLDPVIEQARPALDLDRIIGAPDAGAPPPDLPLFSPPPAEGDRRPPPPDRPPVRGARRWNEDAPLISAPARPRAPLGVRRATPEVPRARQPQPKPASAEDSLFETPPVAIVGPGFGHARGAMPGGDVPATPIRRITAALIDIALLSALDTIVVYFTVRLLGLTIGQVLEVPLLPLGAFLLLLNGGYSVAFTTVGGQSIGKMALGIRVISQEDEDVPIGRAALRTLAILVSALPLGAGFLPGVIGPDRLALHDRVAHTRVVRPSST
jgi:uncharacterized RDD family membrane protein YckC